MAIREIIKVGNEILREKCSEVKVFNESLGVLIDDMIETMFAANGVGLAAPQVSVVRRVCVVCVDGETIYELVNPVIEEKSGEQEGAEGCLSVPGRSGTLKRPQSLVVRAKDRYGNEKVYNVKDFLAVAFCHEIDHLDGVMFIDKLEREE